jgi:flagellar FliL protein
MVKKILIFAVVGIFCLAVGFGAGFVFKPETSPDVTSQGRVVPPPGPVISVGEFTTNLAGPGGRVLSCAVSVEARDSSAEQLLGSPNWIPRIRSEILLIIKDRVYEDLTSAEGMLRLSEEIRRRLNSILPNANGEVPVVRVLFESFVMQ